MDGDELSRIGVIVEELGSSRVDEGKRERLHQGTRDDRHLVDKVRLVLDKLLAVVHAVLAVPRGRQRESRGHVLGVFAYDVHRNALVFFGVEFAEHEDDVHHPGVPVPAGEVVVGLGAEHDHGVDGVVEDDRS